MPNKNFVLLLSMLFIAAGSVGAYYLSNQSPITADIIGILDTELAPHEPNEVIVVFQDDQGGIGQPTSDNTFNSAYTVNDLIEAKLQAILPDDELEIDAKVLFNSQLLDLSSRRQARLDQLNKERENLPNSAFSSRRLVFARARSATRSTEDLIRIFNEDPQVKYAEPNYLYNYPNTSIEPVNYPQAVNNENSTVLWNIFNNENGAGMSADRLWNEQGITGSGTIVALLDTGTDIDHPDLKPNIWKNPGETNCTDGIDNDQNGYIDDCSGWDFGEKDKDVRGFIFHGTHTAGIIAAKKDNSGIVGVAPDARIMALKVFREDGAARTSDIVEAIDYAWRNNADVISLSLGRKDQCSSIEQQAIQRADEAGVFVIASSGNSDPANGLDIPFPNAPAVCPKTFTIGAIDKNKKRTDYSNYFDNMVNAMAPGGDLIKGILSTIPNGKYGESSGTSMAAPHIAGLVALLLEKNPAFTPSEVSELLCNNAEDLGTAGTDREYGCGLLTVDNLINSLAQAVASPSPMPSGGLPLPSPPPIPASNPVISNGRFTPTFITAKPPVSVLAFSVCDPDNNLDGGAIKLYRAGTTTAFPVAPILWSANLPNRSVADCENPYAYEVPINFNTATAGQHCVDLEVTDGMNNRSNKILNLCITIADENNTAALGITPAYQIVQKGAQPQPFTISGGQQLTYQLEAGLTGVTKQTCADGASTCQLSVAPDVGTAILKVVDGTGKSASVKIFVNGTNNNNLNIQKTANKAQAISGDTIKYTLTYRNNRTTGYTNLVITDDYDEKLVKPTQIPANCADDGVQLRCTINTLGSLAQGQITYSARVL